MTTELPLAGGDDRLAHVDFTPTREAGLARLKAFVPRAGQTYAKTRNYDFGPDDRSNVSALSPWIRHRLVTEKEVLTATLSRFRPSTAEKFIQEVFWRAYFKGWLEQHPAVWQTYNSDLAALAQTLGRDNSLTDRLAEAVEGRTGIVCFDTWARELTRTGYLHNHARMWFASIWIFTLELPWQLGADFFYRHLLDGDPASNTLSWRWVGGLHTKGKTYLARADNIEKFTNGRFQPGNVLAPAARPLEEPHTIPLVALRQPGNADAKAISGRFGLLLTDEDARPETWPLPGQPAAIHALSCVHHRAVLPAGERAVAFAEGALDDAIMRARDHFGIAGERRPVLTETPRDTAAEAVVDWAREADLKAVLTAYAPVGPTASLLAALRPRCTDAGIDLIEIRRDYDANAWPHATKGFFALKKKIPELLASSGPVHTARVSRISSGAPNE